MKKLFTILSAMLLATGAYAATEQAWYNDVTSITNNGQYYIYSVNGKGFMQAGQAQVKAITTSNYTNTNFKFTITAAEDGNVKSGNYFLKSYRAAMGSSNSGPVCENNSDDGTTIIWTSMAGGSYWNIHGHYNSFGNRCACLKYADNKYDGYIPSGSILNGGFSVTKDTQTATEYRWYLVSQAQLDRHFAIYFFDAYKEGCNIAQYENLVPAAYYTALQTAYNKSFSVQNAEHSAEVVNAAKADLEALYTGAPAVAQAYANANEAVNTLEAVEDKGEDFAEVTTDIANARTAIEAAMTVDALNAAVAGLKAIDPITFNVTEFEAPNFVTNAASSAAGRDIAYDAADKTIINAEGQAIYAGTTTLTATAAATEQYYKFVRSAQVTVTAPTTYGEFSETTCGTPVEFNYVTYQASFYGEAYLTNIYGGDSIVTVSITINHPTFGTDTKTIVYGADESWNGISLKDSTVGVHYVVFETTNVAGCDSTVTLTLTVNKQATVEMTYPIEFCADDQQEYRGVVYTEAGSFPLELIEGTISDTLITVVVTVNDKMLTTEYVEDTVGNTIELPEGEWLLGETVYTESYELQEADLEGLEFIQIGQTEKGCEAVTKLVVTVNEKENQGGETTGVELINSDAKAMKELINGTLYIRRGERLFTAEGREVK